jgi:hypothetical protein
MNMPEFGAARSLVRARRPAAHLEAHGDRATGMSVVPSDVPGGPGNVPVGYNRECKPIPYFVCDLGGCRIEYMWRCTLKPIGRIG